MQNENFFSQVKQGLLDTCYICVKEMRGLVTDEGVLIFCVLVPLFYPLLYSWIYNNEVVRDVPVAVVDLSHSEASREFIRHYDAGSDVKVAYMCNSLDDAKEAHRQATSAWRTLFPRGFRTPTGAWRASHGRLVLRHESDAQLQGNLSDRHGCGRRDEQPHTNSVRATVSPTATMRLPPSHWILMKCLYIQCH